MRLWPSLNVLHTQHKEKGMAAVDTVQSQPRFPNLFQMFARADRLGIRLLRAAIVAVLVRIGGLNFVQYEADSIVPLVANSPALKFFYRDPGHYKANMNREGELVPSHRSWHQANGTYQFSYVVGVVIVLIGILVAMYPISPLLSVIGSLLLILMSLTTLSFLLTTTEAWVPAL